MPGPQHTVTVPNVALSAAARHVVRELEGNDDSTLVQRAATLHTWHALFPDLDMVAAERLAYDLAIRASDGHPTTAHVAPL